MRALFIISLLVIMFGLESCSNEEEHFCPIDLDVTGVSLKNEYNLCSFFGNISSSENCLTFVASGNNSELGFLTEFSVGDYFYHFGESDYNSEERIISGEWGKIELINSNPYTTKIWILKNHSSVNREFKLTFGGGYIVSWIYITQKGNKEQV